MSKFFYTWLILFFLIIPTNVFSQTQIDPSINIKYVKVGEQVEFDIVSQQEFLPDNTLLWWDFGDGHQGEGSIVKHSYNSAGEFLVTVYHIDDEQFHFLAQVIVQVDSQTGSGGVDLVVNSGRVIINELLPDPAGSDEQGEWIELKNLESYSLNLADYKLTDAGGKQYELSTKKLDNLEIPANGFYLLKRPDSKILLNNGGDTINLYNPDGDLVDFVSYEGKAPENFSWARSQTGAWRWTSVLTPAAENIFDLAKNEPDEVNNPLIEIKVPSENEFEQINVLGFTASTTRLDYTDLYNIRINELLPNPVGDERNFEFIELKNLSESAVNLDGCYLTDNKSFYYFSEGSLILPNDFLVINRADSKIALNNTGDSLLFFSSTKELIDQTSFTKAEPEQAWARSSDGWSWTGSPTPGEENEFINNSDSSSEVVYLNSISEVRLIEKDTQIILQGVVTVLPGVLGKQFFYIQDSTGGLQIYMYSANWPALAVGDVVELTGVVSEAGGEKRVKLKDIASLEIISSGLPQDPLPVDYFDDMLIGSLVVFSGQVIEKTGAKWLVQAELDEVEVVLKFKANLSIKEGDFIKVTGVVRKNSDKFKVYPRNKSDLIFQSSAQNLNNSKSAAVVESNFFLANQVNYWTALYTILSGIIIILISKIYILKNKQSLNIN